MQILVKASGISTLQALGVGCVLAAIMLVGLIYKPVAENWWDRKGFETVVEKTLADRGIVTSIDSPKFNVAEHGTGEFKGRKLQGVVVKAEFLQVDKVAGEKTKRCILMFSLIDKEFDVYRNISLADCSETHNLIAWKSAVNYR
jgi:hypothetical protein